MWIDLACKFLDTLMQQNMQLPVTTAAAPHPAQAEIKSDRDIALVRETTVESLNQRNVILVSVLLSSSAFLLHIQCYLIIWSNWWMHWASGLCLLIKNNQPSVPDHKFCLCTSVSVHLFLWLFGVILPQQYCVSSHAISSAGFTDYETLICSPSQFSWASFLVHLVTGIMGWETETWSPVLLLWVSPVSPVWDMD